MSEKEGRSTTPLIPLVVVLVITALFFMLMATHADPTLPGRGVEECRGRYAAATSQADILAVDRIYPEFGSVWGGKGKLPLTCGDLRRRGEIPGVRPNVPS